MQSRREVYPDLDEFWTDVAAAYRVAIAQLARAGCTYLQLDDVAFAYLCDPKMRDTCRRNGDDPDELPRRYAAAINAALADRPAGMTVTMHTCRGNFKSAWVAEGGYEVGGRGHVLDERRRLLHGIRLRARRRLRAAASAARGQDRRARPGHDEVRRARGCGPASGGGSTPPPATCRSSACACHRSAASRARTTATPCRRTSSGGSSSSWSRSRGRSGDRNERAGGARCCAAAQRRR